MPHGERLWRLFWKVVCLSCFCFAGLFVIAHANADQEVQFESAPVQPTLLQERLARERGEALEVSPGVPLKGYLTRPQGDGPFPAVVLLHGCGGIRASVKETWPERLSSWGYVVLVVDSFSTRGIHDTCDHIFFERVYDAYGALEFLSKSSFVDPKRVALMGFSAGGIATLQAVQLGAAEVLMEQKFKAAVAYYPICSVSSGDMAVPTLILAGELDDWSPAEKCRAMMKKRSGKGSLVQLDVYDGARHAFDSPEFKTGVEAYGHRLEYNAAAADQSVKDVRVFLQEAFGD